MELADAVNRINDFKGFWLAVKLATIEQDFEGCNIETAGSLYSKYHLEGPLLEAADTLKEAASQIDEVIHAVGILKFLPKILQVDEVIESLSLGAGSTGKPFDLITNLRIAEFKFIYWKGGAESIRQNQLFKDFFNLAEYDTQKKRCLYVLDSSIPLKFLNGGRSIESVLSRNLKLWQTFQQKYGTRFTRVKEYYNYRKDKVEIVDLSKLIKK
jgi:hypothetical protein